MKCKLLPENERFRIGGVQITKIYLLEEHPFPRPVSDSYYYDPTAFQCSQPLAIVIFATAIVAITHLIMWLTG